MKTAMNIAEEWRIPPTLKLDMHCGRRRNDVIFVNVVNNGLQPDRTQLYFTPYFKY